jgi:hypothetical protein
MLICIPKVSNKLECVGKRKREMLTAPLNSKVPGDILIIHQLTLLLARRLRQRVQAEEDSPGMLAGCNEGLLTGSDAFVVLKGLRPETLNLEMGAQRLQTLM